MPSATTLVWFRDDLRLSDNPALSAAVAVGKVACLYVLEETDEQRLLGGASKWWLHHSLKSLADSLKKHHIDLILRRGDAREILPDIANDISAKNIFWNRRYDPASVTVDKQVMSDLRERGFEVSSFKANLLFEPWDVHTNNDEPYKVFSPFWKAALKSNKMRGPLAPPTKLTAEKVTEDAGVLDKFGLLPTQPDWSLGFNPVWRPGEIGAQARLDRFLTENLRGYSEKRDNPQYDHTSGLSPHLRFGEISPFQIWSAVYAHAGGEPDKDGWKFLSEIGWREFSHTILFYADRLAEKNWRSQFDAFPWEKDQPAFLTWTKGQTGYPIVDAGMRQLWQTGWMHNRVRMICASFLIKHLLVDWRQGEKWFWDTLVDACPANNPASWQWVAGSGADAAPYFRIFNPFGQSEKFDPKGDYIRRWVPELSKLSSKDIHKPWEVSSSTLRAAGIELGETYPKPIVEHGPARQRALDAFKAIKKFA